MLHRGIYADEQSKADQMAREGMPKLTIWGFICSKVVGIDGNYTKGDKILAWSVFTYSFGYGFVLLFILPIVWNLFQDWPLEWWSAYFYIKNMLVAGLIGVISTIWFGWCGTKDLFRLFKDLETHEVDENDNGTVTKAN